MTSKRLTTGLTGLLSAFIIVVGVRFVLDPHGAAAGFGIPGPQGAGTGFYDVKGVRDIASGLVAIALLITRQRRALGWALLAEAFTPLGDATIVLTHGGTLATALGIHALTAALVLLTAALLLRETRGAVGAVSVGAVSAGAPGITNQVAGQTI
ncbi:DUF4267 domain-containing protein [Kitasatospora sp. NBC_01287]|uniref:DUF4267 domain-containing protein n=1 Tax=Kitasatospora sp. NBC_01287 TaxID=2903573 RepID=UPI00224E4041|nr:DUF4267 domain-containing protein [Kitasatospora sp. NBC_01287]MCX4747584.1 DUF4267 domain-containing protein [Kitasatospora sp. NBC_01287]